MQYFTSLDASIISPKQLWMIIGKSYSCRNCAIACRYLAITKSKFYFVSGIKGYHDTFWLISVAIEKHNVYTIFNSVRNALGDDTKSVVSSARRIHVSGKEYELTIMPQFDACSKYISLSM